MSKEKHVLPTPGKDYRLRRDIRLNQYVGELRDDGWVWVTVEHVQKARGAQSGYVVFVKDYPNMLSVCWLESWKDFDPKVEETES